MPIRSVILALTMLVVTSSGSHAAQLTLADFGSPTVGGRAEFLVFLETDGLEGPGSVDVEFSWGEERTDVTHLGALRLLDVTIPAPEFPFFGLPPAAVASVSTGADCDAGLGQVIGSCTLGLVLGEAVEEPFGVALAVIGMRYSWSPAPGYELCFPEIDPDPSSCMTDTGSFVATGVLSNGIALGQSSPTSSVTVSDFPANTIGVRMIPEPGTASLMALGLSWLARPRSRPREDDLEALLARNPVTRPGRVERARESTPAKS